MSMREHLHFSVSVYAYHSAGKRMKWKANNSSDLVPIVKSTHWNVQSAQRHWHTVHGWPGSNMCVIPCIGRMDTGRCSHAECWLYLNNIETSCLREDRYRSGCVRTRHNADDIDAVNKCNRHNNKNEWRCLLHSTEHTRMLFAQGPFRSIVLRSINKYVLQYLLFRFGVFKRRSGLAGGDAVQYNYYKYI